jgi:hypothetical protein
LISTLPGQWQIWVIAFIQDAASLGIDGAAAQYPIAKN